MRFPSTSPTPMASALRLLLPPKPPIHFHLSRQKSPAITIPNCTSNPNPKSEPDKESPPSTSDLETRRKSAILREGRGTAIQRPDPPSFEIGWKRTKEIKTEKPKGWAIADFLEKLESLMGREYGSTGLLAKVGGIVAERAREEAEVLREGGEVEDRMVTELYRVLKLMEMDLEMVKAAVKEETLAERIGQAKARCRQAILIALSF